MEATTRSLRWLSHEIGLTPLFQSPPDTWTIITLRFVRTFAFGATTLILAQYLRLLNNKDSRIGLFMTLTLLGDVFVSLLLTLIADKIGRRRTLLLGALAMVAAGAVFALTDNYWLMLAAAIIGVISPGGNEIGPFRAIEESILAHLVKHEQRTAVFAWYVVLASVGGAAGLLVSGWTVQMLRKNNGWEEIDAFRAIFWLYVGLGVLKALMTLILSNKCELEPEKPHGAGEAQETEPLLNGDANGVEARAAEAEAPSKLVKRRTFLPPISPRSRGVLIRLCLLFAIDSLASGMAPYTLINYYIDRKFQIPKGQLGSIMGTALFVSGFMSIFSPALAKRIGLIAAMVFTHLPSALFLALLPVPTSLTLTIIFLVGRSLLNTMDQAPRSAFLSAVVLSEERTAVMGIVNVVKTLSQSGGPFVTGLLAEHGRFWIAFVVAGSLKASYDLGLLAMFLGTRLHENREASQEDTAHGGATGSDGNNPGVEAGNRTAL